jgi:hypothetical protein
MGEERATTMARLPSLGWGETVTRGDIERLHSRLDRLDARIGDVQALLDEMRRKQDLAEFRAQMARSKRTAMWWLVASQATVIAAITALFFTLY